MNYKSQLKGLSKSGNISQMMWATSSAQGQAGTPAGYGFTYDGLNRLRSAAYAEGTGYTANAGRYSTAYSYDANGNMATLSRYMDGTQVDNLGYTYLSGGNRLGSVSDGTASPLGYKAVTGNYTYDNNGNMTYDVSKGFSITYNTLNLPQLVSMASDYARYTYDAAGTKLAKTITNGTASTVRTDYSGPFMYENSVLKCIFTPEGRIVPQNSNGAMSYSYEYNLKDHLGNTRVTFTGHGYGRPEVNLLTSYDPYGLITSQTSYYPTGASKNKLLYNGKEFQDDVLAGSKIDWYDYGARMYDPELGRWNNVDPLAEKYRRWSPYNYCVDNPMRFIDPDGMGLLDKIAGFVIGAVTNIIPFSTPLRGSYSPTDASDYNNALKSTDAAAMATGSNMVKGGTGTVAAGAVVAEASSAVEVASLGTGTVVAAPGAAIGGAMVVAGTATAAGGAILMANGSANAAAGYTYGETKGESKGSLSGTKEALKEAKSEIGLKPTESLPKGENGKFGSPQRGNSQKGYRLDPAHPNAKPGSGEDKPHINYWDYTKGKRGNGGVSGAKPIEN